VNRRQYLAGCGAGVTTLFAGCSTLDDLYRRFDPSIFTVSISNRRAESEEVSVTTALDGEESEYGPKTVPQNSAWQVGRFQEYGELTISISVSDNETWDESYEIPIQSNSPADLRIALVSEEEIRETVITDD